MNIDETIARLLEILEQKRVLMEKIYDITVEQKTHMQRENIEVFLAQMKKRQVIADEIDVMDAEFYRHFVNMKKLIGVESLESADVSKHPELKGLKEGVRKVLQITRDIKVIDEGSSRIAQDSMEKLRDDMKKLQDRKNSGKKISSGYASTYRHAQGVFIDNKK